MQEVIGACKDRRKISLKTLQSSPSLLLLRVPWFMWNSQEILSWSSWKQFCMLDDLIQIMEPWRFPFCKAWYVCLESNHDS